MNSTSIFQARIDPQSKAAIKIAAGLRGISQTDYLKAILIPFAKAEIVEAESGGIKLSPLEQIDFWNALNEPIQLTSKQKQLGLKMKEFL